MTATTLIAPKERRELVAERTKRFILECLPGKELEIEIRPRKRERSDAQNHALFGVLYPPFMDFLGLSGAEEKEELHTTLCGDFWGWTIYEIRGHKKRKPKRTTTRNEQGKRDVISVTLFMEFHDFVQREAAKMGCCLPDPDPFWYEKLREEQAKAEAA
jgi:hypothetical protein